MASLARRLFSRSDEQRGSLALPFQDWLGYFNYQGISYPLTTWGGSTSDVEKAVPSDYTGTVNGLYRSNPIVFALVMVRMLHFSEARFQWQQLRNGRPGNLFGDPALAPLEVPWPNGTTQDLLVRMLLDVDLAGNSYIVREGDRLARLRPDWTSILTGSRTRRSNWVPGDADTEVIAYLYQPGGPGGSEDIIPYTPAQVSHFAPYPDPLATYRGMSWITPLLREAVADSAMTTHKSKFLEQGATVNMVITFPTENLQVFNDAVSKIREGHQGIQNAYKTLFLNAGAQVTPVGSSMEQMDFKSVQDGGEIRMAAAAGVHPIIVGFSEGLAGSSLNAGNYQAARRRFADGTIRPLWASASGALQSILTVPGGVRLWYDDRHVAFLKEDQIEAATIAKEKAATLQILLNSGYKPNAAVDVIQSDDFSVLMNQHTGMQSVQLQPPMDSSANGSSNGTVPRPIVPAQSG